MGRLKPGSSTSVLPKASGPGNLARQTPTEPHEEVMIFAVSQGPTDPLQDVMVFGIPQSNPLQELMIFCVSRGRGGGYQLSLLRK